MISFPSTMNKGGGSLGLSNNSTLPSNFQTPSNNNLYNQESDLSNISENVHTASKQESKNKPNSFGNLKSNTSLEETNYLIEDPYKFSNKEMSINTYGKDNMEIKVNMGKDVDVENDEVTNHYVKVLGTRSLFNPINAVNVKGIMTNVPLNNQATLGSSANKAMGEKSDCRIKTLVDLSQRGAQGELGRGIFKYADFMYCADLGKISNNHLITLRRFAYPVGDNIFTSVSDKKSINYVTPDVGRMVAWFDTEDNKLENILTYSYAIGEWKDLVSERINIDTRSDSDNRNNLNQMISNSQIGGTYSKLTDKGLTSGNDLFSMIASKVTPFKTSGDVSSKILEDYDQNKVYTPLNVIDSVKLNQGKMKFNLSITLVFKYKLRAYEGINPKSAFLDLLGNILVTTYRRGKFWGGTRRYIGPAPNNSTFDIANKFVKNEIEEIKNIFGGLIAGQGMGALGGISNLLSNFFGFGGDAIALITGKGNKDIMGSIGELAKGFMTRIESMVNNTMGRPQVYAVNSLLSGADVGFWHLTIGNPRNPIATIGNLCMTNAKVTHSGPLGIDDFPSEIKVEVTLVPGRPRDSAAIERMYTKGISTIYFDYANTLSTDSNGNKDLVMEGTLLGNMFEGKDLQKIFGDSDTQVLTQIIQEMA